MDPLNLSISEFSYDLPEERIAKYPLVKRDQSKLLIYKKGSIAEDIYRNIADHLPGNSFLIFNDTKVVEARLLFQKPTGGVIEIFCLEPHETYPDVTTAITQKGKVLWHCLIGGASKWKHGQVLKKQITHNEEQFVLSASYLEKRSDSFVIELSWDNDLSFAEVLHYAGSIPLPPYIKREAESSDAERYQTIYAHHQGSVAAPTAGLHFTDGVFASFKNKNIETDFVTLHVGAGTFKPVKTETIAEHEMHAEFIEVKRSTIENLLHHLSQPIIAIGTTSLRTIESLYWLGVKISEDKTADELFISQWYPYEQQQNIPARDALELLLDYMKDHKLDKLIARTQIIIAPGYQFKIVHGLVTNFHQPQSTLLLLVAALIGSDWRKVYNYALENDFRFLSYGDGCLLFENVYAGSGETAG